MKNEKKMKKTELVIHVPLFNDYFVDIESYKSKTLSIINHEF